MNSKLSKSRAIHARSTSIPSASITKLRRQKIGSKGQSNVNTGFMTRFRSEIERLRQENEILREERMDIYQHASYMMAHS